MKDFKALKLTSILEFPILKNKPLLSRQKKFLSLKYLPFDREVPISKCWIDKDDVFDYGERLE